MYLTEFGLVCLCPAHLYPRRTEGVVSVLEEGTDQVRAPTRRGQPSNNNLKLKDMPPGNICQAAEGCLAGCKIRREYAGIVKYACGGNLQGEECGRIVFLSPFWFFRLDVEVPGKEGWAAGSPVGLFGGPKGSLWIQTPWCSWRGFQYLELVCCPEPFVLSRVPSFKGGLQVWGFRRLPYCLP